MAQLHRFRWGISVLAVLLTALACYLLWRPAAVSPVPVAAIVVYTPTAHPTETPLPTATPRPLVVYVSGAVARPGVYPLPAEARVADAIEAAGGFTAQADTAQINLARRVRDEEQVHVPRQGEPTLSVPAPPSPGGATGLLNINTASAAELDALPGIGPSYAERIVAYRQANGPFATIEEIQNVTGIGPALFERIRDRITVE